MPGRSFTLTRWDLFLAYRDGLAKAEVLDRAIRQEKLIKELKLELRN